MIFDLEATCWKLNEIERQQETIELAGILTDEFGEELDRFRAFVRPLNYPELSYFCMDLTGIRQRDINNADLFNRAGVKFLQWAQQNGSDPIFCSWGYMDSVILKNDCQNADIDDSWTDHILDLKDQYRKIMGLKKPTGLLKALDREGLEFVGEHHRALDDARNLLSIFTRHIDEWIY